MVIKDDSDTQNVWQRQQQFMAQSIFMTTEPECISMGRKIIIYNNK